MRVLHPQILGAFGLLLLVHGCGGTLGDAPPPLFQVPLAIDGEEVGAAVIDTGGAYEVMLRENFGLEVIDTVEVLAFGGRETVDVTEGFVYTAGGFRRVTSAALVGKPICDCNGLGFHFFRDTGVVLGLDFETGRTSFLSSVPPGGVTIPFERPPADLAGFDTAFIEVDVTSENESRKVLALLDTGAGATLMRRGLVGSASPLSLNRQAVTMAHDYLGTVAVSPTLFDTDGLPDIIIGTDVMGVWANEWYFSYSPHGGDVTVHIGGAPTSGADYGSSDGGGQAARTHTPSGLAARGPQPHSVSPSR